MPFALDSGPAAVVKPVVAVVVVAVTAVDKMPGAAVQPVVAVVAAALLAIALVADVLPLVESNVAAGVPPASAVLDVVPDAVVVCPARWGDLPPTG